MNSEPSASKEVKTPERDLTSVRTLIKHPTELAKALKLTYNGVYRWIKVNRISGNHIVAVANHYDVELRDIMHLTGSEKSNTASGINKPRRTLATLLEVYRGHKKLADACVELNISERSAKMVLTHWGDQLPTLYTTLEQLAEGRITLDDAAERLHIHKYTLHGLRKKYGYAPGRAVRQVKPPKRKTPHDKSEIIGLVMRGKLTQDEAAKRHGVAPATIYRWMRAVSHTAMDLKQWPESLRAALAYETENESVPKYAASWKQFADSSRLMMPRRVRYPKSPESWKNVTTKRMLVAILLGEMTMDEIAMARGGEPVMLASLFTSDLRPLGLTYEQATDLPFTHQVALAEVLLAVMAKKRKFVETT